MMLMFPLNKRPTGVETYLFHDRLRPILTQLKALKILEEHSTQVLISRLEKNARKAAEKIDTHNISIQDLVMHIKIERLYESSVESRRQLRWKEITYDQFRSNHAKDDEATRDWIEHITSLYKDPDGHLTADKGLLNRIRVVFFDRQWCRALFERTLEHQSAH